MMDIDPQAPGLSHYASKSDSSDMVSPDASPSANLLDLPSDLDSDSDIPEEADHDDLTTYVGAALDLPDSILRLQAELLGDYTLPSSPPESAFAKASLSKSEALTLKHYIAWKLSNGTVTAYTLHGQLLESETGAEILSLYKARQLSASITGLHANKVSNVQYL